MSEQYLIYDERYGVIGLGQGNMCLELYEFIEVLENNKDE